MSRFLARRLIELVPLLIGISILSFALIHFAPGDPARLLIDKQNDSPEEYLALRAEFGLDDPLPVQYVRTMSALVRGDLRSFQSRRPVLQLVSERLPTTLALGALAIVFGILAGVAIGIAQSLRPYSRTDDAGTLVSVLGFSMPNFWLALMLILLFAVRLRWLPSGGIRPVDASGWNPAEMAPYVVLPTVVLASGLMANVARFIRSSMLETLGQDYIRTARAKGLTNLVVIVRHALRNSLLPVITLVGFSLPFLIGGAVVVETIFALPGMGRLAIDAVFARDYPIILTVTIVSSVAVVIGNLLADVMYALVDPRIRYS